MVGSTPIAICPFGNIPEMVLKVIAAHIHALLGAKTVILPAAQLPVTAFDPLRGQYDAGRLLIFAETRLPPPCEQIIAVCEADLFLPIFAYVFGEAKMGGRCAAISLFRLQADGALLFERAAKIALHELGHLFAMPHCEESGCLMYYAADLAVLDRVRLLYCRHCASILQSAMNPEDETGSNKKSRGSNRCRETRK